MNNEPVDRRKTWPAYVAAALWLAIVLVGASQVIALGQTPTPQAVAPERWPQASTLAPPDGRPRLLMFLHPRCPCSRASLVELARIVARVGPTTKITAVMVRPTGTSETFARSALMEQAQAIPSVEVVIDGDGIEAARFGAESSGHTELYDGVGRLAFRGGITAGRGHEGDNVGEEMIIDLIMGAVVHDVVGTDVFGCALRDEVRP